MLKQWLVNKLQGPVYLDCYTCSEGAYAAAQIKNAARVMPKWWKDLSPTIDIPRITEEIGLRGEGPTMRGCVGLIDLFKNSFALPLWSDVSIGVAPEGEKGYYWKFADQRSEAGEHAPRQRGSFMDENKFQQIKIQSPWHLKCDEEVEFLLFDPFWLRGEEETVLIPPGVVNYKYQSATNINMFIRKLPGESRTILLEYNTPIVFILPLTERKVILRHHLIGRDELPRITRAQVSFVSSYQKVKLVAKTEGIQKCPMK